MASFITPSSGEPSVPFASRSKASMVNVDKIYQILIQNKSGSIRFSGYVPESFTIGLSSGWACPFDSMTIVGAGAQLAGALEGGATGSRLAAIQQAVAAKVKTAERFDKVARMAGLSSYHKLLSAQVWDAPGYLTLELPIFLDAYESTENEVIRPMVGLLSCSAPSEVGGIMIPPGPIPVLQALEGILTMGETTADRVGNTVKARNGEPLADSANSMEGTFDDTEAFTVEIGKYFKMYPVVIESVSASNENVFEDVTGRPVSADVSVSIKSYFAVTRSDLHRWFGLEQPPINIPYLKK